MMNADFPSSRRSFGSANAFTPLEKDNFQDLNIRLERYISLVKGLEHENVQLVGELRKMHDLWGQHNAEYKVTLSSSLVVSRNEYISTVRTSAQQAIRAKRIHANIDLFNRRIESVRHAQEGDRARCAELQSEISKAEADLQTHLRDNGQLAEERAQLTAQNAGLYSDFDRIYDELDVIRLELAECRGREERLLAEKDFLLKVQEREIIEIKTLLVETTFDARKFFENDIALAIRDIKVEYETSHKVIRTNVQSYYYKKIDEMRRLVESKSSDEIRHRREQIGKMESVVEDLRGRFGPLEKKNRILEDEYRQLQGAMVSDEERYEAEKRRREVEYRDALAMYQRLQVEKGSMAEVTLLELEIYRKMIECEEKRWGHREVVKMVKESFAQITKHRTYSGDIRIKDCDEHGKYVIVENAGHIGYRLSGYRISRIVNGSERSFTFPALFVLAPRETVQVLVHGYNPEKCDYSHQLTFDSDSWGTGGTVVTHLFNNQGSEISNFDIKLTSEM